MFRNRAILPFMAALLLAAHLCRANGNATSVPPAKTIAVMRTGDLEEDVFKGVIDYTRKQYGVPVREAEVKHALQRGADGLGDRLKMHVRDSDVCLLVLVGPEGGSGVGREITLFPSNRLAVLDTGVLRPGKPDSADKEKTFKRRVEMESLRTVALLMGVPACPFWGCALQSHRTDKDLDRKSRNPCPPCQFKIRKKLREAGASPFAKAGRTGPSLPGRTAPATVPVRAPHP